MYLCYPQTEVRLCKTYGNVTVPETAAGSQASSKANAAQSAGARSAGAQGAKHTDSAALKTPRQEAIRSVSSLITAAGLPQDKLSASIISFARFFSLPIKPELLKHIRQQALAMTPNATPSNAAPEDGDREAGSVFKTREALSLAASAAEGKGVDLQPKGLEAYAKAIDPESRQDGGQSDRRGRQKKNDDDNDSEETTSQKTTAISAASLQKLALEGAEKDPLLAILNRLPEKDGKRWIVLPFDFSDNGSEFKASLRILLETGKTVNRASCMALDIAIRGVENTMTEKRQLFVLEPANRLSVYLQPEITPDRQPALARELSALLEIAPERIFIKAKTESFPFEADCGNGLLGSIDEAV